MSLEEPLPPDGPPSPQSVAQLEEQLTRPTPEIVESLSRTDGDLIVLGVGGKMGPTLAGLARRALDETGQRRRVIGVSRFGDPAVRERLERWGVTTLQADLLDERAVANLPAAPNVMYMAGFKFGAAGAAATTWAANCYAPALTARRYADSRIVAFSTGNVYRMSPVASAGAREDDPLEPIGEYAMTALGRERMFEYFSQVNHTAMALLRLNYATELRYGVLVDIAQQVLRQQPIDLTMGHVNVIWLRDANAMALAALAHTQSPPRVINIAGEPVLRIREVAQQFGRLLDRPVSFTGHEADNALLNDGRYGRQLLGQPPTPVEQVIRWTADWVAQGGQSLGKPTHFQVRDGQF